MKSTLRITGLLWADIFVGYTLFVMQDYLTDVWGLSLTHAAAILNVCNGISLLLHPFFLVLVNTLLGNLGMLLISSISYALGILFVFMSAPPVLENTCKHYDKECIGHTQKALFYAGMALIAVGVAGNKVSLMPFLDQQVDKKTGGDNALRNCLKPTGMVVIALVGVAGAIGLPYIKPWTYRFGIPAVCTAIATLFFLTGLCFYKYETEVESSHRVDIRAMFSPRRLPMWITFVICGMVSSIGNTYFVEQASNLNRKLGTWKVPSQVLMFAQKEVGGTILASLAACTVDENRPARKVVVAKTFAVLCCIIAAIIEKKRLHIVRSHGLLDSPDEAIPMSMFWLLFQFVLLGGLDSLLERSVAGVHEDEHIENSEKPWFEAFTKGVSGLGYMYSVVCVHVVGEISGESSWFQPTLNRSRLDNYYWFLAVLTGASSLVFVVMRLCCCAYRR